MSARFIQFYKALVILTFLLIALGGSVRAMNAGLSCPDWPLCFGDVIPDYHPEVYFEFIHRVWAGFVGLLTIILNVFLLRSKQVSKNTKWIAILSIILLFAQVMMGGLTVLLQLHEEVVTTHLALGTSYFASLLWIYLSLRRDAKLSTNYYLNQDTSLKYFAVLGGVSVFMQILLGGFVASHYAALVCPEFPLCHGKLIPTFQGTIGLQVIHRLGAYALTVIVLSLAAKIFVSTKHKVLRRIASVLCLLIITQVCIGISNVLLGTPPLITVLHLSFGVAILAVMVELYRRVT